jgi:RimJ/RimL family protein N-acetyltransferase
MPDIELITTVPSVDHALSEDPEYQAAMSQEDWPRLASVIQRVVGQTIPRTIISATPGEPWRGYFAVDVATRELVGSCAFKSSPTPEGNVEIAYFTYPPFEGRGYATAMARALVALALNSGAVRTIVAHTLPETNASTRVLQKTGMTFVGEVIDPDDGRVWRWELAASKG